MSLSLVKAEYSGFRISFDESGWFNATAAAAHFGRRVDFWIKTNETKDYIAALGRHLNTSKKRDLIKARRGRHGGTWLHPRLAVAFARWCSPDFAVWCDLQIDSILRGQHPHYNWKQLRHSASASHKVMAEALRIVREERGKVTCAHHYVNECRLINWVLTGCFTAIDRESLSDAELDLLAKLETRNAVLVARGLDYQARKVLLREFIVDHQPHLKAIGRPAFSAPW